MTGTYKEECACGRVPKNPTGLRELDQQTKENRPICEVCLQKRNKERLESVTKETGWSSGTLIHVMQLSKQLGLGDDGVIRILERKVNRLDGSNDWRLVQELREYAEDDPRWGQCPGCGYWVHQEVAMLHLEQAHPGLVRTMELTIENGKMVLKPKEVNDETDKVQAGK